MSCKLPCLVDFQFRFPYSEGWNKIEINKKTSGNCTDKKINFQNLGG